MNINFHWTLYSSANSIQYGIIIGHIVLKSGILSNEAKIMCIRDMPPCVHAQLLAWGVLKEAQILGQDLISN